MIGKLSDKILNSLLEAIPIDFSVIDANDKILAWNKDDTRIFKRSEGVIGRNVRDCHPKKSLDKVEKILLEMKNGKRNKAEFWINIKIRNEENPKKIFIQYLALRDDKDKYLGCLECSQEISYIQSLKGEKRLLN